MAAALSNYQLGDCVGKGASGQVFRALNWTTGETVAIKKIQLSDIPKSELSSIMSEIELLKNLIHANIVKYKGFARDSQFLFIVLEYCENGSLSSICKRFGKFPENLVAVYITQVLDGLVYLHAQGVIHRDIKGANILTNKDGSVKLADFGVSSKGGDMEVVGSPYWMAPEVIEQSGATTASDIWSVGCVVIELLEGKQPYHDLAPMQALFRIVQDDNPPIPEGASPIVKDFLYHCFQKDCNLRITAKKLLRHPWMASARKQIEATQNANGKTRGERPLTVYDEAVQRVQEWNEALAAPPKAASRAPQRPSTGPAAQARQPRKISDRRQSGRGISALNLPGSVNVDEPTPAGQGVVEKTRHVTDVLSRSKETPMGGENWDDDFAGGISFAKLGSGSSGGETEEHDNMRTLMPSRAVNIVKPTPVPTPQSAKAAGKQKAKAGEDEDYSDLLDDGGLAAKVANLKLKTGSRRGLYHPDDIKRLGFPTPNATMPLIRPRHNSSEGRAGRNLSPKPGLSSPSMSRENSMRCAPEKLLEARQELQKYSEQDDADYSDIFESLRSNGAVAPSPTSQTLQLNTRRSNKSWLGEDDGDDEDPFAEIEDDFDEADLEANLLRDKKAALCASVSRLVEQLQPTAPSFALRETSDELLALLETQGDMELEEHFVSSHGMLAILEVLEAKLSRDVVLRLLKIVNLVIMTDLGMLEAFCLIGGIPVVMSYTSKRHSLETRLEASTFVRHLTSSALTLQMFISCRGLKILVELLDEDYSLNRDLVLSALEGIDSVFELQSPTPRNDFCRMFVREGISDPLSTALLTILKDPSEEIEHSKVKIVHTILLFCQTAQADSRVREAFGSRSIIIRLLKACDLLQPQLLVTALKAIKHLSTSPELIDVLQISNAMEVLVRLLGENIKGTHSNDVCSHIFQTVFSMCRLSRARQEEAASAGIVPLLKRVIETSSPLKQFALPILCDLANAGKVSRRMLWRHGGLTMYLDLLPDPYWRVSALEAIHGWLQDETARVEDVLLEKAAAAKLSDSFVKANGVSFEGVLDPLLKIFRLSSSITLAVCQPSFVTHLVEKLSKKAKAVVKLNLLRITRVICDSHPDRAGLVERFGLADTVDRLAHQDEAVLVRQMAKEIAPVLGHRSAKSLLGKAGSPSLRRTTSESAVPPFRPPIERPKHKRKLSRNQLRDVQWVPDQNGQLQTVRPKATGA